MLPLPSLLVAISAAVSLSQAASLPRPPRAAAGSSSVLKRDETCVYSGCPFQPLVGGAAIDEFAVDSDKVVCVYPGNTFAEYERQTGRLISMADQYGVPDSNKNFDTTLTLTTSTGTCTPKSPSTENGSSSCKPVCPDLSTGPSPSHLEDGGRFFKCYYDQGDTVGICGYDSTSYELLEGSTSECALHAITSCPTADTESSFPAPVDPCPDAPTGLSAVGWSRDFTDHQVTCYYATGAVCTYDSATYQVLAGSSPDCYPRDTTSSPPAANEPSPVTPSTPDAPRVSGTVTTCKNICPEANDGTRTESYYYERDAASFGCNYEAASFTFECLYDKQTFDLVSAARDQGRCAERAPPTCTSVLTRRAKPETAYSRALKARQWSREKLATKLLASE